MIAQREAPLQFSCYAVPMPVDQIVGIALLAAGVVDIFLAQKVLPSRQPEQSRSIVTLALTLSGVMMLALGTAAYYGLLPLGGK